MLDDQEAVQELKCQRGYSEEVERDEHLSVISEKREPILGIAATRRQASKIPGNGTFRDLEAEFQ